MKKIIALVLLLCVLSASAIGMVAIQVNADKDTVTIKENAMYGDSAMAHGLSIRMLAHYNDHLYWDVSYAPGEEPVTKTDFDFSLREKHEVGAAVYDGISLDISYPLEWDTTSPQEQLTGLSKAYRELYESTPEGEEATKTVYIKDYYDYYPISVRIHLPQTVWTGDDALTTVEGAKAGDEIYEYANFREFFKIPVDPSETIEVVVDRDKSNGIMSQIISSMGYPLYALSTYTSSGVCYFSIYNRTNDGTIVDTSRIPGGYGLYSFQFGRTEGVYDTGVYADTLRMVYALDEEVVVKHITTNADQTKLLLFTLEGDTGDLYMTVIDIATMTAEQKLPLADCDFYHIWEYEKFMVLGMSDRIALITLDEDGSYELRLMAATPDAVNADFHRLFASTTMVYDGERLVMINSLHEKQYQTLEICSFYLAVYDKNGLSYYGEYESSLSVNPRSNMYSFNCLPSGANPFKISWNE